MDAALLDRIAQAEAYAREIRAAVPACDEDAALDLGTRIVLHRLPNVESAIELARESAEGEPICRQCRGSGEGQIGEHCCGWCHGSGVTA